MIRLITATPGSGKTCIVIEWLLREIDRGFYKEFYTNIDGLTVCGVRPLPEDCDWRKLNPNKSKDEPPKLVIIDECQYISAFMKENRSVSNSIGKDLSTHRHYGIDIWFITQSTKLLNDYVLENVGEHVHLYRPRKRKSVTVYWWSYVQKSLTKTSFKDADDVQVWRLNPAMFNYYKSTSNVTDAQARISKKLVTSLISFFAMICVIFYFVSNGLDFFTNASVSDIANTDKAISIVNNSNQDDLFVADNLQIEKREDEKDVIDEPKKDDEKDVIDEPKKDDEKDVIDEPKKDLKSVSSSFPDFRFDTHFEQENQQVNQSSIVMIDNKPSMIFADLSNEECFVKNKSMQQIDLTFDECKNYLQNISNN